MSATWAVTSGFGGHGIGAQQSEIRGRKSEVVLRQVRRLRQAQGKQVHYRQAQHGLPARLKNANGKMQDTKLSRIRLHALASGAIPLLTRRASKRNRRRRWEADWRTAYGICLLLQRAELFPCS